jgi:hypothetical protein
VDRASLSQDSPPSIISDVAEKGDPLQANTTVSEPRPSGSRFLAFFITVFRQARQVVSLRAMASKS